MKENYYVRTRDFTQRGTWSLVPGEGGALEDEALRGRCVAPKDGEDYLDLLDQLPPYEACPAIARVTVSDPGEFHLWVKARDYGMGEWNVNGFEVEVNGQRIPKTFGVHGQKGYIWEYGGKVMLPEGTLQIQLHDTSGFYASFDSIMLSRQAQEPPSTYREIIQLTGNEQAAFAMPHFPAGSEEITGRTELEGRQAKVVFLQTADRVLTEIYARDACGWTLVKARTEPERYLVLKAEQSRPYGRWEDFTVFDQTIQKDGTRQTIRTFDIFKAGQPQWLVPRTSRAEDGKVHLEAENDWVKLIASWSVEEFDPQVTLQAQFKKDGAYSFGIPEGVEQRDFSYANAPFRVYSKAVRPERGIINEQFLFTPMASVTLPGNNRYAKDNVTKGLAVDPVSIPLRWVYAENSRFGIGMRGVGGGVQPWIFAPLFGTEECHFKKGDRYVFTYRILDKVSDWWPAYKHVAQNLFGVHDYRKNYYHSVTDAVLNTTDLMLDPYYSGWDEHNKSFYNMEMRNVTSVANPMEILQRYLLTENREILNKRAIPTMAAMLTQPNLFFVRNKRGGGSHYYRQELSPMGQLNQAYNLNVWGGMYEQTRGMVPCFYHYGMEKSRKQKAENHYGSIPSFANDLYLYQYTQDPALLEKVTKAADAYIEARLHEPETTPPPWENFFYISYYPNLAALMDLYEITGEVRYLKAAEETGRRLAAGLWVPGIDGDKKNRPLSLSGKEIAQREYMPNETIFWWHGDAKQRPGCERGYMGRSQNNDNIPDETVPAWVPSRVGLGHEQASTYQVDSLHIIMSDWAGDFLRLAGYTGDGYFEQCARNAVVGRFGNYPGYYQNRLMTYQQRKEYPYEGPDLTSVYWHHIPPFLAMLESFLINQAWLWSGRQICFPSARQQGYAYFNSLQYGHEAGRFFDQDGMWLWLDRDIIDTGNIQLDWIAARKDGVFACALMNEDDRAVTTKIKLLDKVPVTNGTAYLYQKDGTKSQVPVVDAAAELTLPPRQLVGLVIQGAPVQAPEYAKLQPDFQEDLGATVSDHGCGKGYLLQMTPQACTAYIYCTQTPDEVNSVTLRYEADGRKGEETTAVFPFEFFVELQAANCFTYQLDIMRTDGTTETAVGSLQKNNSQG